MQGLSQIDMVQVCLLAVLQQVFQMAACVSPSLVITFAIVASYILAIAYRIISHRISYHIIYHVLSYIIYHIIS